MCHEGSSRNIQIMIFMQHTAWVILIEKFGYLKFMILSNRRVNRILIIVVPYMYIICNIFNELKKKEIKKY